MRDARPRTGETARPRPTVSLTHAEAVSLAERYVGAYNDRDLEAMLAVQHPQIESYPARLAGAEPHRGHAGVRAWWDSSAAAGPGYRVEIREVRLLDGDRAAIVGEIRDGGEPLGPWCAVIRIRDGLIVESRSYLSDDDLLEQLGLVG